MLLLVSIEREDCEVIRTVDIDDVIDTQEGSQGFVVSLPVNADTVIANALWI